MIGICSAACGQRKSATLLEECGDDIFLSPVTTRSPPHQSAALTASPRGEAYVLSYVGVIAMVFFYISHAGFANRLPLGVQLSGGQLEIKSKNSFVLKVGRRSRVG